MAPQVVRTHKGYVDADIYGRANDHLFGQGAAAASALEAKRILAATRLAKAHIRPQDVVDYDLYGRGDPRVFGEGADIVNKTQAVTHLISTQKKNKYRLRRLMFKSNAVELVKRGAERLRKIPSGQPQGNLKTDSKQMADETLEKSKDWSTSSPRDTPHRVSSRLPSEEVQPEIDNGAVLRGVKSFTEDDGVVDVISRRLSGDPYADDDIAIDLDGPSSQVPKTELLVLDPRAIRRDGSRIGDPSISHERALEEKSALVATVLKASQQDDSSQEGRSTEEDAEETSSMEESGESSSAVEDETSSAEEELVEMATDSMDVDNGVGVMRNENQSSEEEVASSTEEDDNQTDSDDVMVETDDEGSQEASDNGGEESKDMNSRTIAQPVELNNMEEKHESVTGPPIVGILPSSKSSKDIENSMSPTTPATKNLGEFGNKRVAVPQEEASPDFIPMDVVASVTGKDAQENDMGPRGKSVADRMAMFNSPENHSPEPGPSHVARTLSTDDLAVVPASSGARVENLLLDEDTLTKQISYHEVDSRVLTPLGREKSVTFRETQERVDENRTASPPPETEENTGFWGRLNFFGASSPTRDTGSVSASEQGGTAAEASNSQESESEGLPSENSLRQNSTALNSESGSDTAEVKSETVTRQKSIAERVAAFARAASSSGAKEDMPKLETSSAVESVSRQKSIAERAAIFATSSKTASGSLETSSAIESVSRQKSIAERAAIFATSARTASGSRGDESNEDQMEESAEASSSSEVVSTTTDEAVSSSEMASSEMASSEMASSEMASESDPTVSSSDPNLEDSDEMSEAEDDEFVDVVDDEKDLVM